MKIMSSFEGKIMQTKYNLLGFMIDLYFHDFNKNLVVGLLELILTKKILIFSELSLKYLETLDKL